MSKHGRILVITSVLLSFIISAGVFCISDRITQKSVQDTIEKQVSDLILSVQNAVVAYNDANFSTIHIASSLPIIRDPNVPIKQKAEQLFGVKDADPSLVGLNITDLQGNSYLVEGPLYNFSERAYFKNALQGKETVFGPIINKVTNLLTIFYGAPLYDDDGALTNTFFLAAHGENLSKICAQYTVGKNGGVAIVRRTTGLVIADVDQSKVLQSNIFDDAADSGVKALQDMTSRIADGKSGFELIKMPDGKIGVNGYAPIDDTDWSVIVKADYDDFTASLRHERVMLLLFSALMLVISALVSLTVGKFCMKEDSEKN